MQFRAGKVLGRRRTAGAQASILHDLVPTFEIFGCLPLLRRKRGWEDQIRRRSSITEHKHPDNCGEHREKLLLDAESRWKWPREQTTASSLVLSSGILRCRERTEFRSTT